MSPWLHRRLVLDRIAAAALGALLSPFIGILAAVIWARDGRPAFVGLPRVGRDGEPFVLWKLRTMGPGSGGARAAGPAISGEGDQRVTTVGRPLRHYRLDELPQLLNVVRGEMSLIGPRPETPEYVETGDPRWKEVLQVRPGIAGLTQVAVHDWEPAIIARDGEDGYRREALPVKLAVDAWYVNHATPGVDFMIAVSLVQRFVFGRPPYKLIRYVRTHVAEAAALPLATQYSKKDPAPV